LVRDRIEYAIDDPLSLEMSGYAMFDMYPERRGNIFSDEVRASRNDLFTFTTIIFIYIV
jgi:hypothetical protein